MFRNVGRKAGVRAGLGMLLLAGAALSGTGFAGGPAAVIDAPLRAGVTGAGLTADAPLADTSLRQIGEDLFEGRSVKNDLSPALRDIKPGPVDMGMQEREHQEINAGKDGPQIADPVLQSSFGLAPDAPLAMPAPSRNFAGLTNRNGVYPPDTSGEIGANHYMQWVNLSFQIFNRSGVSVYGPANGNTLWSGFGGACQSQNSGDPIVLYDQAAARWVVSQFTSSSPYGECIAVSTTSDPTGSWYRYFFQHSTTVFYDYPHMSVWADGYYTGFNRFGSISFLGPAAVVYDRSKMLSGLPATFQERQLSTSYGTLIPADRDGSTAAPAGTPGFFLARATNAIQIWKFKPNWTTPSSTTFTGPTTLTTASYNRLCSSTRSCIAQPGTSVGIDGIGDRLMFRVAYRKFATYETLVLNHSVNAASSGTRAGIRWYEIRNPNGTPSIYQQGTYAPADTTNRWMGSIAQDKQGNMALGYSVSSSSVYPGIRYTGRLVSDALGTLPQGEVTLISGGGSQTGTGYRWGDYSHMSIDPTDDCTFWYTTEYMASTSSNGWRTRIGSFKYPGCQ